jgi:predicted CXXCH cytochrome family protein
MELYGDCLNCHEEHDKSVAFHTYEEPYNVCTNCHPNYEGNITTHDRSDVTYLGVSDVGNDLCERCHLDAYEGLDQNKQHRGLDCVYCHSEHLLLATDFTECTVCHPENIPSWHDEETDDCTKSRCHGEGWYH